jgi:integrase
MKTLHRLKPTEIAGLIEQGGIHKDGGSLYLVVRAGRPSWVFQQRREGKLKSHGLGPYPATTLQQARKARDLLASASPARRNPAHDLLGIGTRPTALALAVPASPTFAEAASLWFANMAGAWGPDQLARNKALLRLHASDLDDKAVHTITTTMIGNLLRPPTLRPDGSVLRDGWTGPGPSAKSKTRGLIEKVLDSQEVHPNPATWARLRGTHLTSDTAKTTPVASLHYTAVPALMAKLAASDRLGTNALRFITLTGVRISEALEAKWGEIEMAPKGAKGAIWSIPAERKGRKGRGNKRRAHFVPLSPAALACLGERGTGFLFPGNAKGHLGSNVIDKVRLQFCPGVTAHGMRSSLTDWAAEQVNGEGEQKYSNEVREMSLSHVVGDATETVYKRTKLIELRRPMMDAWADFATA